jgi:polysaccharide biosynthesis/export protein
MARKILGFFLILNFLVLAGLAWAGEDYRLGPEDELEIKVWSHEDLTRKMRVGLKGTITFPFVGEVKAQGLTVQELQGELEKRLGAGYIVDPHVTITVTEYKSQKYFVVGNVAKPGTYPLTKPIKVVEAISQAGGVSAGSVAKPVSGAVAIIVRAQPGEKPDQPKLPDQIPASRKITVSISAALAGDPKHNVEIKNGDTVFVPSLTFYVSGEVKKPGRYPYEENMTVLMGVTVAEGFTDKASVRGVYILREEGGGKTQLKVKLTDMIKPGDNIVVPESFF